MKGGMAGNPNFITPKKAFLSFKDTCINNQAMYKHLIKK
jgi:hypothetical protein